MIAAKTRSDRMMNPVSLKPGQLNHGTGQSLVNGPGIGATRHRPW
jgi:hypothetical protein